jgi:ribosome-associated protein
MFDEGDLIKELRFRTSRSSGKGGQSVNKVSSKVELIYNVNASQTFSEEEKLLIITKSGSFLKDDTCIHIICQEDRSQYMNKKKAVEKFIRLINKCLKIKKKRIETRSPSGENEKRLTDKKQLSDKKQNRKKPDKPFTL